MLKTPMDILTVFPVRKTNEQRNAFHEAVQSYLSELGYECIQETGNFGCRNLIVGPPETAKYLITAGNDTSAVITLLEIARTMPENQRQKVCFVLFGSAKSYRKAHESATDCQLVFHLERICPGDQIRMLPTAKLKNDRKKLTSLYRACGYFGKKSLLVDEKGSCGGFSIHNSFPYAVKVCTIEKKRSGNHSNGIPDQTNINILRAALTTYICCDAVQ